MHKSSNDKNISINSSNIKQILIAESLARYRNANNSKRTHGSHNEILHDNMNFSEEMKESLMCFEVIKGVKYPYMVKMLTNYMTLNS